MKKIHHYTKNYDGDKINIWQMIAKRKILIISTFVILFFLPIAYLTTRYLSKSEAAWMDDQWGYRQTVAITNAGAAQTDFQVSVTVDTATLITAGKMQSDCDDIRVTDVNGKMLPYWIEESPSTNACNATTTKIWTKVPSISTSGTTVYLYYGNSSASAGKNGEQTFVSFDNFNRNDNTTVGNGWSETDGAGSAEISSNQLKLSITNTTKNGVVAYKAYTTASAVAMEYSTKNTTLYRAAQGFFVNLSSWTNIYTQEYASLAPYSTVWINKNWYVTGARQEATITSATTDLTNFYRGKVEVLGTTNNYSWSLPGTNNFTDTQASVDSFSNIQNYGFTVWNDNNASNLPVSYIDWFFIRKSATTMPVVGAPSTEQKSLGPVAYWKFDEGYGTTPQDSTSGNYDGSFLSAPVWKTEDQCVSGKCLSFDNVDDGVSVANQNFTSLTDYTMSAWINIKGTHKNYTGTIISSGDWNVNHWAFGIDQANTGIDLRRPDGTNYPPDKAYAFSLNQWTYVAITRSGSVITYYVNGKNIGTYTGTTGNLVSNATNTTIGRETYAGGYFAFNGFIDEPKIYNYARSAAQIKADFLSKGAGSIKGTSVQMGSNAKNNDAFSNGLVGYWKMDEASWTNDCTATSVTDSSGNANNGKACPTSTGPTGGAAGKFGNAGSFDGTNDYVLVPSSSNLNVGSNSFSTSFWINSSTSKEGVINKYDGAYKGWRIQTTNGRLEFYGGDGVGLVFDIEAYSASLTGGWHQATLVIDKTTSTATWYIDGSPSGTPDTTDVNVNMDATQNLWIGDIPWNPAGGYAWQGSIDEVRIYNRALSPREVRDLYAFAPGPKLYYNLEEGSGSTVNDISGSGYTGTVLNGTNTIVGKFGKGRETADASTGITFSGFTSGSEWSMMAWSYFPLDTNAGSWQTLFANNGGTYHHIIVNDGSGEIGSYNSGWYSSGYDTDNLSTGWHHVAAVASGSTTKFYIDGVLVGTSNTIVNYNVSIVGNYASGGDQTWGKFDDVKIYNYARSSKQIVEDMNAGHPVGGSPVGSQVGYWKFDEGTDNKCSGGTNDLCNSGNGGSAMDGAQSGMAVPATSASGWTNSGKFGKALSFDGTNDFANFGANSDFVYQEGQQWTTSLWFKTTTSFTGINGGKTLFGKGTGGAVAGYAINIGQLNSQGYDNKIGFTIDASPGYNYVKSTNSLPVANDGNWHYVAIVFDASSGTYVKGTIYFDGKNYGTIDSAVAKSGWITTNAQKLTTGSIQSGGGQFYTGTIDEVKIYSSALTEDEIKLDYNRGSAMVLGDSVENRDRVTSGQMLYLDATDKRSYPGSGTAWNDLSGNNYNASLSSPTWNGLKFTNTAATLTNLGSSVYPNISTNTTILWVYPELGGGGVWNVTDQDAHTYMTYTTGGSAYINTWETGTYNQRTVWDATESVPHQIVITKNGSVRTVYDNLVQKGQVTITNIATSVNTSLVYGSAAQPMGLSIVETYNRVLSMDEITQDYYAHAYKFNLNAEPVAEWNFEEGTGGNTNDISGNGVTCALQGAASFQSGKVGKALSLSGASGDYATCGTTFNPSQPITLEGWVYMNSLATNNIIAGKDGTWTWYIRNSGGTQLSMYGTSEVWASYTTFVPNTWYFVTTTIDSSNNVKHYVNGQLIANTTGTTTTLTPNANTFTIGKWSTDRINGKVDNLKVFNYARTQAQIAYDYNRGAPVGHWKFDECQGITANDASGNGNSGTITIGATVPQTSAGTCTDGLSTSAWNNGATGKYNSSLRFDGVDDYMTRNMSISATDGTVAFWVKDFATGAGPYLFRSDANVRTYVGVESASTIYFYKGNPAVAITSTPSLTTSNWNHIVLKWWTSGGTQYAEAYANGKSTGSPVTFLDSSAGSYITVAGFSQTGTQNAAGQIDDVRVFNYALTAQQVQLLFNQGSSIRFGPSVGSP